MHGKVSSFGGPNDPCLGNDEGLALYHRRCKDLDPDCFYCAVRMKYELITGMPDKEGKAVFQNHLAVKVTNPVNRKSVTCSIVDWGPGILKRIIDVSPGVMKALDLNTDDSVDIELIAKPGV